MTIKKTLLGSLLGIFILASCTNTSTVDTQATSATAPVNSAASIPSPTSTPSISPTPTLSFPVFPAPPVPDVSAIISLDNIDKLTRLTSFGEGDILGIQNSPDGKWVVINSSNGVLLLDSKTLQKALFLPTEMNPTSITFMDNNTKLAAQNCDQGYIWSLPDGKEISHFHFFKETPGWLPYWYCKATLDKQWEYAFIKKTDDKPAGLYQLATGNALFTLDDDPINVAMAPDNNLLALTTSDQINILQFENGTLIQQLPETGVQWLFFSPDGKILAAVFADQTKVWSTEDFHLLYTINATGMGNIIPEYPYFSPDGSILVFRKENTYRLIRAVDGAYINAVSGFGLKFSDDNQFFTVDNGSGQISVFQVSDDRSAVTTLQSVVGKGLGGQYNNYKYSNPGVLSADGTKLLAVKLAHEKYADEISEILVYDFPTNSVIHIPMENPNFVMMDAVWLQEQQSFGVFLESSYSTQGFYVLDLETKTLEQVLGDFSPLNLTSVDFNPKNTEELAFLKGGQAFLWQMKGNYYSSQLVDTTTMYLPEMADTSSPDGKYNVTLAKKENPGYREHVQVFFNGTVRDEFTGFSNLNLAFSPDSKMIAISTFKMLNGINVSIFNVESGELLFTTGDYFAMGDYAPKVAFSPDGKYFVIMTQQGYPQVWGIP